MFNIIQTKRISLGIVYDQTLQRKIYICKNLGISIRYTHIHAILLLIIEELKIYSYLNRYKEILIIYDKKKKNKWIFFFKTGDTVCLSIYLSIYLQHYLHSVWPIVQSSDSIYFLLSSVPIGHRSWLYLLHGILCFYSVDESNFLLFVQHWCDHVWVVYREHVLWDSYSFSSISQCFLFVLLG